MAKFNFPKITRVVAGVSLVTAATVGCSEDVTNPNVINDGMYTPLMVEKLKEN